MLIEVSIIHGRVLQISIMACSALTPTVALSSCDRSWNNPSLLLLFWQGLRKPGICYVAVNFTSSSLASLKASTSPITYNSSLGFRARSSPHAQAAKQLKRECVGLETWQNFAHLIKILTSSVKNLSGILLEEGHFKFSFTLGEFEHLLDFDIYWKLSFLPVANLFPQVLVPVSFYALILWSALLHLYSILFLYLPPLSCWSVV